MIDRLHIDTSALEMYKDSSKTFTRNMTSSSRTKYLLKRMRQAKALPASMLARQSRILKQYTVAKKYCKQSEDGVPLPGTLEEDFNNTPERFFDHFLDKALANEKRHASVKKFNKQLTLHEGTTRSEMSYRNSHLPGIFKVKKTIQSKGEDLASDNTSLIPITDTEINSKYKEVLECVNNTRREVSRNSSYGTQQERILETHRKAEAVWNKHLKAISKRLHRLAGNSVVSRADHYRQQVEEVLALEQVTLSEVKHGPRRWKLGLRSGADGEGGRGLYLRAGKTSDGPCYCVVDYPKRVREIVRSPKVLKGTYKTFMEGSWSQEKMRKEGKRMRELMPPRGFEELQAVGASAAKVEYEGFKVCKLPKMLKVESPVEDERV